MDLESALEKIVWERAGRTIEGLRINHARRFLGFTWRDSESFARKRYAYGIADGIDFALRQLHEAGIQSPTSMEAMLATLRRLQAELPSAHWTPESLEIDDDQLWVIEGLEEPTTPRGFQRRDRYDVTHHGDNTRF